MSTSYTQWSNLPDDELTLNNIQESLSGIKDDLWVAAACVDRLVDNVEVQRKLLQTSLERTEAAVERAKDATASRPSTFKREEGSVEGNVGSIGEGKDSLTMYFQATPADAQLCYMRAVLLKRLDRLNTFVELCKALPDEEETKEGLQETLDEWEDDPWAEEGGESSTGLKQSAAEPPIPLSEFLTEDLLTVSCLFASLQLYDAIQVLYKYHASDLWAYRFTILDSVPEHAHPSEYRSLLPALDTSTDVEQKPHFENQRSGLDWSETPLVCAAILASDIELGAILPSELTPAAVEKHLIPLQPFELSAWYRNRVDSVIASTGMVDIALATVQFGASQGIPNLDGMGEELSLLARLVYDAPQAPDGSVVEDWTLARWNSMTPAAVVAAYLANSTPDSVAKDIPKLVIPYLFVLESQAERSGHPDPGLPNRLLYEYILTAPLEIIAAIFDASKPTLPAAQRLIRNDEDIARVALACLYGSDRIHEWGTMSRIFECLPAWDIDRDDDEADEADTTITSLGAFVTPSTTHPRCTAADLLIFFTPLPISSLSRALDILDVHLEGGEILARWSVAAPLRWFLQSSDNAAEQRAWATRMARRAGGAEDRLDTRADWDWLLEDMLKLTGTGESGLKGAFGLLPRKEVISIFFSGLLSTGKFAIAKDILRSSKSTFFSDASAVEDICLASSKEFYDNASSGNYKFGDMRLAYECLDVSPQSVQIRREKDFIEATSRISSFNVMSRPGIPIPPIEIRLTKDRLSLVSRVLSSNADAYKHTQVILDLVYKLGFRDDVAAEVKTLAMLTNTALYAEDFERAYGTSEEMVAAVLKLRSSSLGLEDPKVQEASEVCWMACWQLGRQPEFDEVEKKLLLLGRALELCPADRLQEVLKAWSDLEKKDLEIRRERIANPRRGVDVPKVSRKKAAGSTPNTASSLTSRLQEFRMHMPASPLVNAEDAAALAGRTFNRVTAHFPFSVGHRDRSRGSEDARSRSRDGSRPRPESGDSAAPASVFGRGIGWLIGADDE